MRFLGIVNQPSLIRMHEDLMRVGTQKDTSEVC
jgi:hypothetical protein